MTQLLLLIAFLGVSACDSPGIGGAGFDNKATVEEAEKYPRFIAPFVQEIISSKCEGDEKVTQQFGQMFRGFDSNYPKIDEKPVPLKLTNASASYSNRMFEVREGEKALIQERLPSAFYMHPLSMGIHTVGGREIIMITQ